MKLNDIKQNAYYDMQFGEPKMVEKDNDGSSLFRFNIEKDVRLPEDTEEVKSESKTDKPQQVGYKCCEVRFWGKPSVDEIVPKIVALAYTDIEKQRIVANYNKHVLKMKVDKVAVDNYIEYLQLVEDAEELVFKTLSE